MFVSSNKLATVAPDVIYASIITFVAETVPPELDSTILLPEATNIEAVIDCPILVAPEIVVSPTIVVFPDVVLFPVKVILPPVNDGTTKLVRVNLSAEGLYLIPVSLKTVWFVVDADDNNGK